MQIRLRHFEVLWIAPFLISVWALFAFYANAANDSVTVIQEVAAPSGGNGGIGSSPGPSPTPVPTPEPLPEPIPEPIPEPTPEPTPEPIPEPTPEPAPEPIPQPVPTPIPQPPPSPGGIGQGGGGIGGIIQDFLGTPTLKTIRTVENFIIKAQENTIRVVAVSAKQVETFVKSPVGQVTTQIAQPLGAAAGALAVGSQALLASATIHSFSDIYLFMIKFVGVFVGLFRRKKRPWGTVYDSITKRPLDPAYVVIQKSDGTEAADAITDLDGRYGFFIPLGTYTIKAQKTHYLFPSQKLAGKTNDEMYERLYFGEEFTTLEGEVVVRNIPLDPATFDWNEFAKNKQELFKIYSQKERITTRIYNILYMIGFFATLLTTIFDIRPYNFIFLLLYVTITCYQLFWLPSHKARMVLDATTREPISFAIVRVFLAGMDKPTRSVVADQLGRFYLLVSPGEYYITIEEKQSDGSYQSIYRSPMMNLKKGVLTENIMITRTAPLPSQNYA